MADIKPVYFGMVYLPSIRMQDVEVAPSISASLLEDIVAYERLSYSVVVQQRVY
jgi:hypothetical protein